MELSQESAPAVPAPEVPLRDELAEIVYGTSQESVEHPWEMVKGEPPSARPVVNDAYDTADAIMQLLQDRGHYLPGAPPAAVILNDAKSFAERLVLSNLALRILNMLAWSNVQTPETKPARKWIEDYLEGRNHGPVGQPMLWPGQLPGMCHLLRDWGFQPTIAGPGQASYVARALPNPTVQ